MSITISGDGDINATGNDIELNSTATTDVTLALGGGSVGIGTATPTKLLDVNGSVAVTDITPSSGIYLGGTGSANLLDDIEEGTFSLSVSSVTSGPSSSGFSSLTGAYRKVNDKVTCFISFDFNDSGTNLAVDNRWTLSGLPFSPALTDIYGVGTWWCYGAISSGNNAFGHIGLGSIDAIYFYVTHVDGTLHYSNPIKGVFTYLV